METIGMFKLNKIKETNLKIASKIGVSDPMIGYYKKGIKRPTKDRIISKFETIYNIKPEDWVIFRDEKMQTPSPSSELRENAIKNNEKRKNEAEKRSIPHFLDQFQILEGCQCPVCHFYNYDHDRDVCKLMVRDITGIDCRNEKVVFIKKEIWIECDHSNTQPGCVVRHKTSHLKSNVVHVMPQDTGEYKYDVIVKRVDNGAIQKWNMMNLEVLEELNI